MGTSLYSVLDGAGITVDPDRKDDILRKSVVITAKDGYESVISLGEIEPVFGNNILRA